MPNRDDPVIEWSQSSERGLVLEVKAEGDPVEGLFEDSRTFSYSRYAEEIHRPVALAIEVPELGEMPRCLDMPLRLPGESAYRLPEEWSALEPLVRAVAACEHRHNPSWRDYHTYLTVDCGWVEAGEQQRHGGLHVDGFQGERIDPKTRVTRNYLLSNFGGTRVFEQRMVVADPSRFNVFHGFDMQTSGWGASTGRELAPGVVHFIDAYTVHESGVAERAGLRVFVRITYDIKRFDRLGNTHNSMLDYDWLMVHRDTQDQVASPDVSDLIASPHYPPRRIPGPSPVVAPPLLVGISGKPGSGKNWVAFRLVQELRHRGVSAGSASIAKWVYREGNPIMADCAAGLPHDEIRARHGLPDSPDTDRLLEIWHGEIGEPHPVYGYHRRNRAVREGLEALTDLRRSEDVEYWFGRMRSDVEEEGLEAAVFSDLRFPDEADAVRGRGGVCLRADVDPEWIAATTGRDPGYKYSAESLSSPVESALDDYPDFFARLTAQSVDAEALAERILSR